MYKVFGHHNLHAWTFECLFEAVTYAITASVDGNKYTVMWGDEELVCAVCHGVETFTNSTWREQYRMEALADDCANMVAQ